MLKDILLKTTEILNRDDLIKCLKNAKHFEDIENETAKGELLKLKSYCNFVLNSVFENFIDLTFTETLRSDEEKKIYFYKFIYAPLKILYAESNSAKFYPYALYPNYIVLPQPNTKYTITYTYSPKEVNDLCDVISIQDRHFATIISYGIVSEYLASKGLFKSSEFWKNRFCYEIFKYKVKKDRRIKPTFFL